MPKDIHVSINQTSDNELQEQHPAPEVSQSKPSAAPSRLTRRWVFPKRKKAFILTALAILGILLTANAVILFSTFQTAQTLQAQAATAQITAQSAYDAFKAQDLPAVDAHIGTLKTDLEEIKSTYSELAFYQYVPFANRYYADGEQVFVAAEAGLNAAEQFVDAVEPYSDVLGFSGDTPFEGGTAEDRIGVLLQTLQLISPQIDGITGELVRANEALASIDASRYPETLRGRSIRPQIIQVQEMSEGAITALTEFRPVLEQLPSIAGATGERRKYLVLFQNDNELRPTGGFLTAYAIINVENGKVTPEKSDDIYELDKKFRERLPIPEALGRYLTTERYWNLRDMNISPDFKTSMDTFYSYYQNISGEPSDIDGIIAIDTEFLKNLMSILGPTEVPGYGTFSAENDPRCDCPQIIYVLSEIITRPTPYLREDRKGILGPMMQAILAKAYGAPRTQWPELFASAYESMQARHIQLYFLDEENQRVAEVINAAGRMTPAENNDFLAIVNANLGGAKSNLFTEYSVEQEVGAPENGKLTKTVTIAYRNTRKGDNCNLEAGLLCLNSTLRDWTRLYVPEGSELISANGFSQEPKIYDEAGFTVFDGFFILEPNSGARITLTYMVPYADTEDYRLNIWKQGGIEEFSVLMDVTGGQEELMVNTDTTYQTKF